ncbi:class I SAM-dependent methyltransferase [Reyranella sp. CPCC 100927]|uniref:class I SAM-dependent methyltransferase n=1 Tax=Reyranella sp. CPCC 100927 TaxID=2599616 RepID=UPI0011B6A310|nr:class I SAM-dependent methyltransferase [Reyranella sp. CPCC 100927]TWT12904.1 methyltransferase domain-containing protein [Reyranella sp. CPCC 100927]
MHDTALAIGKLFFEVYAPQRCTIVEIGSMDVNGSLRAVAPPGSHYIGIDIEPGRGVDLVTAPGADMPLRDGVADVAMASSVFEHDPQFWRTFNNLCRITKPGGYIYINAPSNGKVHGFPVDCWRFYPDAGTALEALTKSERWPATLIESFIAERASDTWNDFAAVFRRDGDHPHPVPPGRVYDSTPCRNIYDGINHQRIKAEEFTEDMRLLTDCTASIGHLEARRVAEVTDRDSRIGQLEASLHAAQEQSHQQSHEINRQLKEIERQSAEIEARSKEIEQQRSVIGQRDVNIAILTRDLKETSSRQGVLDAEVSFLKGSWSYKAGNTLLVARRQCNSMYRRLRHGPVAPLFDRDWYLKKYPDVARSSADPFRHYVLMGAAQGYDSHPLFDTSWYLQCNPDVAASGVNPLVHFLRFGARERRSPHPLFDCEWYAEQSMIESDDNPLLHYLHDGAQAGCDPHPLFDTSWYLATNPDVAGNGCNPLVHFVEFGARELRNPHPLFDCHWYLETYPDVLQAGLNPLEHYLCHGAREGRRPGPHVEVACLG